MAVTKVVMPKLSDAMESGKIIKWLKKEGDRIAGGDILAEVETDKADVEMEAFGAGVLRKILVPAGESAPIGALIGGIAEPGDDIAPGVRFAPPRASGGRPRSPETPTSPGACPGRPGGGSVGGRSSGAPGSGDARTCSGGGGRTAGRGGERARRGCGWLRAGGAGRE